MPVLEEGDGYVTLGVRHFSELGVGAVSETDAAAVDSYDTGFKPGVDDFHMENNGSYIEPGGHCAGQSLATMWYYANKKLRGGPKLWDQYDNYGKDANVGFKTPDMQEDDVMALRIASVAQREATWSSNLRNRFMEASKLSDKATFYGLTYGMKLHKSPQYVSIQRLDASGNVAGGHAIIAYRYEGNRIYVADPNYRGKPDGYLELVDVMLKPFSPAATAGDAQAGQGKQYTRINYVGISALYDHPKLTQLCPNWKAGPWAIRISRTSIRSSSLSFRRTKAKKEEEVVDGYESQTEKLIIKGVNTSTPMGIKIYVTDGKGQVTKISKEPTTGIRCHSRSGITILASGLGKNNEGNDFKWVKVLLPFPYAGEWAGTVRIDKDEHPPAGKHFVRR